MLRPFFVADSKHPWWLPAIGNHYLIELGKWFFRISLNNPASNIY